MSRGNALAQTEATQYHAQLGLPDKGRAIKGLVVCNTWDLEPLGPAKRSGPRFYQPSSKVLIVSSNLASTKLNPK